MKPVLWKHKTGFLIKSHKNVLQIAQLFFLFEPKDLIDTFQ